MSMGQSTRRVLVVGGGLAGLSAAISSAQRGARVTLCESHVLGRDKVCGEFLSSEVGSDFDALGCEDWIDALSPVPMQSVSLIGAGRGHETRLELTIQGTPGRSLTRCALESFLAARARSLGVEIFERSPVRSLEPRAGRWRFSASSLEGEVDQIIAAFGKRSALDAAFHLPRAENEREHYAAAKVYFPKGACTLASDVELYMLEGGYVGLNPVEDGRLALCALLPGDPTHAYEQLSARLAGNNEALARRLDTLGPPEGPVRGLARFGFGPQRLAFFDKDKNSFALLVGDAAQMMPSFTGEGMAVALRSGRLAAAALAERDPPRAYARTYGAEFRARIAIAGTLHHLLLRPTLFEALAPLVRRAPRLVEALYDATRGR